MQNTVRKKRIFPGIGINRIWEALVNSDKLDKWFMETNFQAAENTMFEFLDKPGNKWKGVFYGEVISFQPPINLAYSWSHKKLTHTTYVWWKLESKGDTTVVEIEHSGFKGFRDYMKSFGYSHFWDKKLKDLLTYLTQKERLVPSRKP